jgi:predicted small lipoprotein YifL
MSGGVAPGRGCRLWRPICYRGRPSQEHEAVKVRFARIAVIGALAAAFALSGCGRKGPLDPPPGAENPLPLPAASQKQRSLNPLAVHQPPAAPAAFDSEGRPVAARGVKRPLPMDWLIE